MHHSLKLLSLVAVLLFAQYGAVVHELSHVIGGSHSVGMKVDTRAADATCAECPAFAQAATPAFSHAFQMPLQVLMAAQLASELAIAAIEAALPDPRSRGPPASS